MTLERKRILHAASVKARKRNQRQLVLMTLVTVAIAILGLYSISAYFTAEATIDSASEVMATSLVIPDENGTEPQLVPLSATASAPLLDAGFDALEEMPETETIPSRADDPAVEYIAKMLYGESLICSTTNQAATVWCVINRLESGDAYYPTDLISIVTQPGQFHGYRESNPVLPELVEVTVDVLERWEREKAGETDVGRVLPSDYLWFWGDGTTNHFQNQYQSRNAWDWSLPSPYED